MFDLEMSHEVYTTFIKEVADTLNTMSRNSGLYLLTLFWNKNEIQFTQFIDDSLTNVVSQKEKLLLYDNLLIN
jgi:hypothetical protein